MKFEIQGAVASAPTPVFILHSPSFALFPFAMRGFLSSAFSAVLLVLLVFLGACSSDAPSESEPVAALPVPSTQNDITTAVSEAGLDTLARLLRETGLADSLRGEGPNTLFAPTDLAFTELPGGSPDGITPAGLAAMLAYHIIPGRFETTSLAGAMDINTLHGGSVTFTVDADNATISDESGHTANLVMPDMNVDNGVVHIIDRVLMPGSIAGQ